MKYKNIIFDFGNVLATFQEKYIAQQYCEEPEFQELVFEHWQEFDAGDLSELDCMEIALEKAPESMKDAVRAFFQNWYKHLVPMYQTWEFIKELKERGTKVYILSNAPVQFAENSSFYEIVHAFDGIVFSAPIKMAKPEPEIYKYLFETYGLEPKECFFLDDKPANIEAGRELGMDGIVYTGDVDAVKEKIGF